MAKEELLTCLLAGCCMFAATMAVASSEPTALRVVPAVQSWKPSGGVINVRDVAVVVLPNQPDLTPVAALFRKELEAKYGPGQGGIDFVLSLEGGNRARPEGYRIEIGDPIIVRACTPTGVFYGTRTLLQLLAQSNSLQTGTIEDWPDYRRRMIMLDVGRKPFPMPVLRDYLRILSWYKMNEMHLHLSDECRGGAYTGFRVESETFPGLASKDLFYSKKELREFQDEARLMGITITPEIDMPGHALHFTRYWPDLALKGYPSYLDVTNTNTVLRMNQLLDEMIPLFDAPDFHIGTDEYRIKGNKKELAPVFEDFRRFINTINAHVRSKGKNTRIWSGFEHMPGKTKIDPSVIIDMWETDDANAQIADGHNVINSNHGRTYIVPGAHYYGVNNASIYDGWEPWMVSKDMSKNPKKGDSHLLGGKLHVWNDQGPTGYDMTEIADLALPSIQVFAEKMWGKKGSESYTQFKDRAAAALPVPGVSVFDRMPAKGKDGLVFSSDDLYELTATNAVIPLMRGRVDLESPWTLIMEIFKTADTGLRGVVLSSELGEICSDFDYDKGRGIGVIRAAGTAGKDPAGSYKASQVNRRYSGKLRLNEWTRIVVIGDRGRTKVYVDGKKSGESNDQMVCPLERLGSVTGNSFVGKVRRLKVYNRILSDQEIPAIFGSDAGALR